MSKKILMISSTWSTAYIQQILVGMLKRLEHEDADLYVFNAYDEALENEYQMMERAIYSLPNPDDFDGILLAINSVGNQSAANMLADHYRSLGKPVLSMELQFEGIPSIGTDNYHAEYELVEHMIAVHGCRTFNYVGGPELHMENQERFRAFCDCLKAHNIPIQENRIRFYSFNDEDGRRAYQEFAEKNLHLPDAVVCANDSMALGYCSEASEHGLYAPRDYKIVGFDNSDQGAHYFPAITSVERCWEDHGYESIDHLLKLINGIKLSTIHSQSLKLCLNSSCGCREKNRDHHKDINGYYTRQYNQKISDAFNRQSRKKLVGCINMTEFQSQLADTQKITGTDTLALCLNASMFLEDLEEKLEYDQEFLVYTDGISYSQSSKEGLLPKSWEKDHKVYFFAPLHFEHINFGYCVIANVDSWYADLDHRTFMESICLALESIRQHANLERANQRLNDLYVRDSMTGMYNRFGYENYAKKYYKEHGRKVQVYYFDLDNLKVYNDCFGHTIGDKAILGISHGLRHVFGKDTIYVRMGGDEFLVICPEQNENEYLKHKSELMAFLEDYSKAQQLPFSIQVSIGSINNQKSNHTLDEMIWIADHNMYQNKQQKRRKSHPDNNISESKLISSEFAQIIENIPDLVINQDEVMNVFRKYVPNITSQYGILYLSVVQAGYTMYESDSASRREIVLYDVRSGQKTNDYCLRFETNHGGFITVTAGLHENGHWTSEMKKDVFLLSKTIYLLIGRAAAMNTLNRMTSTDHTKDNVLHRKIIEKSAPKAFLENEFVVYYQPKASIMDINHFKLNGGEALVRWIKDGKMIMPAEFIDIFEQSDLITQLDLYVFEQVCKSLSEWKHKGLPLVRISSNFSRRHLNDKHLPEKIESILKKYDVDPKYLEIEITESYDLEDMAAIVRFEKRMHALGIHLSVDDFGSGFSSLKMIKNIISDTIKLDKSIIDGIGNNPGDEIIVQHMVQMILSLGKEVVAEGVESYKQAVFLRENNCTNIQGFLFGKPMEKEHFEVLLVSL